DEFIDRLRFFFDDNLLLAALDLVDRDSGTQTSVLYLLIRHRTPWGHLQYQVLGTTATYLVFPGEAHQGLSYCTCPSFTYSVLLSGSQFMCKHLLATVLAERMTKCIDRTLTANDLASTIMQRNAGH
ncbi:hypothetical protein BDW22DRAFT_1469316, partial [Trametopsis cervina]